MSTGICFGVGSLADDGGGITRVSRMTGRALIEGGEDVCILALLDSEPVTLAGRAAETYGGSKIGFAARVLKESLSGRRLLFDALGPARAAPPLFPVRRPYATWMHGIEVWEGMRADYARALRGAALVITNSNYTLERHQRLYGRLKRVEVCHLATEEDDPPDRLAAFDGPPTVLILSRITATETGKGHLQLLECWPRVVSRVPDARLVIAGGGAGLEALRAEVRAMPGHVRQSIEVTGFVPSGQFPALFGSTHVFAMPSRQEGFGIVYVEAMRYGVPVIVSRQDAGQEVNADGQTGYSIDLDRRDELTERLIAMLLDRDRTALMGQRAHERWLAHFRFSQFAARFMRIWRDYAG